MQQLSVSQLGEGQPGSSCEEETSNGQIQVQQMREVRVDSRHPEETHGRETCDETSRNEQVQPVHEVQEEDCQLEQPYEEVDESQKPNPTTNSSGQSGGRS